MVADLTYRGADGRRLAYRGADGRRPCLPRS